ncbi:hypothetical protein Amsp01_022210 [Amycolatopsis sp. NBRC 101858]|nr:hypothetical protein Amsp01_022210 [Amycolatopsis sp. NBRC 101858]
MYGSDFAQLSRMSWTIATTAAGASRGEEDLGSGLTESAVMGWSSLAGDGWTTAPDHSPPARAR